MLCYIEIYEDFLVKSDDKNNNQIQQTNNSIILNKEREQIKEKCSCRR